VSMARQQSPRRRLGDQRQLPLNEQKAA